MQAYGATSLSSSSFCDPARRPGGGSRIAGTHSLLLYVVATFFLFILSFFFLQFVWLVPVCPAFVPSSTLGMRCVCNLYLEVCVNRAGVSVVVNNPHGHCWVR